MFFASEFFQTVQGGPLGDYEKQSSFSMFFASDFSQTVYGIHLANEFLRAYFDVFRQNPRSNLSASKRSWFFMFFFVFFFLSIGGPFINVFLRAYFEVFRQISRGLILTFLDKIRGLIYVPQNAVRSLCFWSFFRKYRGDPQQTCS